MMGEARCSRLLKSRTQEQVFLEASFATETHSFLNPSYVQSSLLYSLILLQCTLVRSLAVPALQLQTR
jgi:hypothetical protein